MKYLNKNDIITGIVGKTGLTAKASKEALDAFVATVSDALKAKKGVRMIGFGSFKVNHRKARNGRNPQTGKPLKIAARDVPVFKAGASLKKDVNK